MVAECRAEAETLLAETRPDFAEVKNRWNHFWEGEVLGRPLVLASAVRPGCEPVWPGGHKYYNAINGKLTEQAELIDRWLESTIFLGESVPFFGPDFGPDQYAAFFGAELKCVEASKSTSWVEPVITDWEEFGSLEIDHDSRWWKAIMEYSRALKEHSNGRYLVGCCDLHSNADTLLALCGAEKLCFDFIDEPEAVAKAMREVRLTYQEVYDALYEAGGMSSTTGTIGWLPLWCEGKFATIQCDFICMVSPETSREYIIPALEEEAGFLDRTAYHLDGPGALAHLDDILAIRDIDLIQWVSGAGQKPMHEWTEVLEKCRAAGKGLIIYGADVEQAKLLHRKFGPEKMVYQIGGEREEIEGFMSWLEKNT